MQRCLAGKRISGVPRDWDWDWDWGGRARGSWGTLDTGLVREAMAYPLGPGEAIFSVRTVP